MGVAGGLNDNASIPGPITSFFPNGFGLYNMAGNVNEWVSDVYRPLNSKDLEDFNPYRGNIFTKYEKDENGEYKRDSLGNMQKSIVSDEETKNRRNYQKNNLLNFMDGDSSSMVTYNTGYNTGPETVARSLSAASLARTPARPVLAAHGALHARVTSHGSGVLLAALAERCLWCTACGGRRRRNAAASSGAGASWICSTAATVAFQRS